MSEATNVNDGGPAFPVGSDYAAATDLFLGGLSGMSLREWFAGQALPGVIAEDMSTARASTLLEEVGLAWTNANSDWRLAQALQAYKYADAMIAARKQAK